MNTDLASMTPRQKIAEYNRLLNNVLPTLLGNKPEFEKAKRRASTLLMEITDWRYALKEDDER